MKLKKKIKEVFWSNKDITIERYNSSRTVFVFVAFLFFLNFYLVWAGFYSDILIIPLWYLYVLLISSFIFYFYFLFKKLLINNEKTYFNIIIFIILLSLFSVLLLPIILKWWLNWILELFRLYF